MRRLYILTGSTNGHVGQSTPMAEVEPYLVQLIIQLADMRTPITTVQGQELANSLISGTNVENEIMEWKGNNCHAYKHASVSGHESKKLGLGYWRSFLWRKRTLNQNKKSVKFDNKCAEWCTYENIQEMYEEIYQNLCGAGLACKHPEPLWKYNNGKVYCGSDASQVKDGQVGGQKILCSVEGRLQEHAAT
jgi:hypothetical protein